MPKSNRKPSWFVQSTFSDVFFEANATLVDYRATEMPCFLTPCINLEHGVKQMDFVQDRPPFGAGPGSDPLQT
jgi:hypothetical protein